MSDDVMVVTCGEPDALAFLLSCPADDLGRTTLVATADVVRSASLQTAVANSYVIDGFEAIDEVRRLIGGPRRRLAIVIAPDPWGPLRGKGFVRARLFAPWFLDKGGRADLIELRSGGYLRRVLSERRRGELVLRLYTREVALLCVYLVHVVGVALAIPTAAITLSRLVPFVLWTEARARFRKR